MRSVHLIVPDLFLPADIAAEVARGLALPALERVLARGVHAPLEPVSLEALLCDLFLVPGGGDTPVAAISAAFDGLGEGGWLRADPAHMQLQRTRLVLQPLDDVSADEAAQLCGALDAHFVGQGMSFFAPHPQRWYVRLAGMPEISTVPLSLAAGRDVRGLLPGGADAPRWQRLFNEMQMVLHAHPVNEAREARGESPVNSVWLWGNGAADIRTPAPYVCVDSDEVLAEMFAQAVGARFSRWTGSYPAGAEGDELLVWTGLRDALQRGDLDAWRAALQGFENSYLQPLWRALRRGDIARLQLDVPGGQGMRRILLTRADAWAFWRRPRGLAGYPVV